MGDIKKLKKKYWTPMHPWSEQAIAEEKELTQKYGLVKKKEIYISSSFLKKYKNIAKKLIADKTAQGEKEKKQMMDKLQHLGLLPAGAVLDQVLGLQLKDVLERRLQSLVHRKGLARSMNQARQFIVHRHVLVGADEVTSPGFLVTLEDESNISFKPASALSREDHPERVSVAQEVHKEVEAIKGAITEAKGAVSTKAEAA